MKHTLTTAKYDSNYVEKGLFRLSEIWVGVRILKLVELAKNI